MGENNEAAIYGVAALGGLVVVVAVIAILVARGAKKKAARWLEQAKANGLSGGGTYPLMSMSGSLDGISVSLANHRETTYRRGSDERKVTAWCEASARVGGLGDLEIAEEGLLAKLSKLVGGKDLQTGDPRFDKRFIVRSTDPEGALAALTPAARAALLELEDGLRGEVTVQGGDVRWKGSVTADADRALDILRRLAATAKAFRS